MLFYLLVNSKVIAFANPRLQSILSPTPCSSLAQSISITIVYQKDGEGHPLRLVSLVTKEPICLQFPLSLVISLSFLERRLLGAMSCPLSATLILGVLIQDLVSDI